MRTDQYRVSPQARHVGTSIHGACFCATRGVVATAMLVAITCAGCGKAQDATTDGMGATAGTTGDGADGTTSDGMGTDGPSGGGDPGGSSTDVGAATDAKDGADTTAGSGAQDTTAGDGAAGAGAGAGMDSSGSADAGSDTASADAGSDTAGADAGSDTASGDGGGDAGAGMDMTGGDGASPTFTEVYSILMANCAGGTCHVGAFFAGGGLSLADAMTAYTNLVGANSRGCRGQQRVVPGDPDMSVLVQSLEHSGGCAPAMPRGKPMLSSADIDTIRAWITAGAMND